MKKINHKTYERMQTIADKFDDVQDELRDAVDLVEEAQAKAVLETAAEVVGGLQEAFEDYQSGEESAWMHRSTD